MVHDDAGTIAAAAGLSIVSDATEVAVRIEADRITARGEGRGACHTVATV